MNFNLPLISVIVPVYNGDRYLAEAIESVLVQDYHPIEIIVIDDGSTDRTRQVAESFQKHIHYIYQLNRGAANARNTGLKIANGELIAFLDADDTWESKKSNLQLDIFADNPSTEIVLGYLQRTHSTKSIDGNPVFENYDNPVMALSLGAASIRRSVFDRVGLFDEELQYADDLDWFMRARELNISMKVHTDTVLFYRRHDRNMTNQVELGNQYLASMFKKSLDRRRGQKNKLATSLSNVSDFQIENTDRVK